MPQQLFLQGGPKLGYIESMEDDGEAKGLESTSYMADLCYIILESQMNTRSRRMTVGRGGL